MDILSTTKVTVEQAQQWAKNSGATPLFIAMAPTYWEKCKAVGVNPAVAYCQFAKETGYGKFGGVLNESFCNPCGLKTTNGGDDNDPNAHKRFNCWADGISAHIDHLALYAGAKGYPKAGTLDPRHFSYLAGKCKTVESLGGSWAPSASYGTDIVAMVAKLEATTLPKTVDTAKVKSLTAQIKTLASQIEAEL